MVFSSFGYSGSDAAGKIRTEDLAPVPDQDPVTSFQHTALNLNAVLRWEYRQGSTLYAVYTRSQQNPAWDPASGAFPPATLAPQWGGPTVDTFMVKWSYWWNP